MILSPKTGDQMAKTVENEIETGMSGCGPVFRKAHIQNDKG